MLWRLPPIPRTEAELVCLARSGQLNFDALIYTLLLGRVFSSIGVLEQTTVTLTSMAFDSQPWRNIERRKQLTFGRLVSELERDAKKNRGIQYLLGLGRLRNYLVHNYFWEAPFPGDLHEHIYMREDTFDFLEKSANHFHRANLLLGRIFVDAGLLQYADEGRMIVTRSDFWDRINILDE